MFWKKMLVLPILLMVGIVTDAKSGPNDPIFSPTKSSQGIHFVADNFALNTERTGQVVNGCTDKSGKVVPVNLSKTYDIDCGTAGIKHGKICKRICAGVNNTWSNFVADCETGWSRKTTTRTDGLSSGCVESKTKTHDGVCRFDNGFELRNNTRWSGQSDHSKANCKKYGARIIGDGPSYDIWCEDNELVCKSTGGSTTTKKEEKADCTPGEIRPITYQDGYMIGGIENPNQQCYKLNGSECVKICMNGKWQVGVQKCLDGDYELEHQIGIPAVFEKCVAKKTDKGTKKGEEKKDNNKCKQGEVRNYLSCDILGLKNAAKCEERCDEDGKWLPGITECADNYEPNGVMHEGFYKECIAKKQKTDVNVACNCRDVLKVYAEATASVELTNCVNAKLNAESKIEVLKNACPTPESACGTDVNIVVKAMAEIKSAIAGCKNGGVADNTNKKPGGDGADGSKKQGSDSRVVTPAQRLQDAITAIDSIALKKSVWKDAEGNFNTARLVSDSVAGVVLGTAGGVITGVVVKKNQLKKGFEDIVCTVGGQEIGGYGDEITVGVR